MRFPPHLLFSILIFFSFNSQLLAQNLAAPFEYTAVYEYVKDKKELDRQLINGPYHENHYISAKGHPFLLTKIHAPGEVNYNGIWYKELLLKYDIFEQDLIIYSKLGSSNIPTLLTKEFVGEFTYMEKHFEKHSFTNEDPEYYQVVASTEDLSCLYYWYKTRSQSTHKVEYMSYEFSKERYKSFLLYNEQLYPFNNKRMYVEIFPKNIQKQLLNYLKSQKIRFKRASEDEMDRILNFSQELLSNNPLP